MSGNVVLALLCAFIGGAAPRVVVANKIERRTSAFLAQLPDTLQLLAGSLKAGYGLLQAIDTVVQETDDPTSTEFARVLTEARLGMPLEDALEGMAGRMRSEDFGWVVMAINIQKQVGGNLAALLEVVAGTLREREQVRRQVKVLSAEGRLSAVVLIALPFFFAGYLALVNGEYLGELLSSGIGLAMIAGGIALMALGIAWIRKIIAIEV